MSRGKLLGYLIMFGIGLIPGTVWGCSVAGIVSNVSLVRSADAVIRARAVEYATPPSKANLRTTGVPDSRVRFEELETIRGTRTSEFVLPGYLVQRDDFNDQRPPYTFVRPGGRAGSCFANSYRQGAEYLLFLQKTNSGDLTVNWAALAPVNEQLHSHEDAWLLWVREEARRWPA
jgi:hypothetical protein